MRPGDFKASVAWLGLAGVLAVALLLRMGAFWLPHWRGDQAHYVILAAKIDRYGMERYSLRGAQIGSIRASENPPIQFMAVRPALTEEPGPYLELMKKIGQGYYDEPLHMRAPLFPMILTLSHRLFGGPGEAFIVLSSNLAKQAYLLRPAAVFRTQFWAAVVPIFFNLLTIAGVILLGWKCFADRRIGLLAGFILATDPLSIWLSHKLLTDLVCAFWVLVSFVVLCRVRSDKDIFSALTAGIFAGLAFLTNQRMGLIVPIAMIYLVWRYWPLKLGNGGRLRLLGVVGLLTAFAIGFGLLAIFWIKKVIQIYGHPFHMPDSGMYASVEADTTGWFNALNQRPHMSVLYSLGVWFLSPMMVGCLATLRSFRRYWNTANRDVHAAVIVMLWLWVWGFYIYLVNPSDIISAGNREHRYFYPAYPAMALLAGQGWFWMASWLKQKRLPPILLGLAWGALLSLQCWRGATVALSRVVTDNLLF